MKDKWISVNDQRPEYYKTVIVYGGHTGTRTNIAWLASDGENDMWIRLNSEALMPNVTHWMPLPEPPTM